MARIARFVVFALVGFGALALFWYLLPNRLFYQHQRPTRFGRAANRVAAVIGAHAPSPDWNIALEVPGRRSGKPHRTALVLADVQGERYAVSMLGERSEWLRNVLANDGDAAILHQGVRQPVHLASVPADERAPILRAYLQRAIGGRPHFPITKDASLDEFARIAAEYPVMRIEPVPTEGAVRA